jgi:hypothetical protein
MDQLSRLLDGGVGAGGTPTLEGTFLSLLLALLLGQTLAWTYYLTHRGLSYSRTFVQSLVLISIVVAMVMSTVASSLITALGLLGAMALIRFRNILKDTRDTAFLFGALVAGMAAGAQRFGTAIVGTAFVCVCAAYLHLTNFGAHQPHDAFLQLRLGRGRDVADEVLPLLDRFCRVHTLLSVRREADSEDSLYAFQLHFRTAGDGAALVGELERAGAVSEVALTLQEQLVEA